MNLLQLCSQDFSPKPDVNLFVGQQKNSGNQQIISIHPLEKMIAAPNVMAIEPKKVPIHST